MQDLTHLARGTLTGNASMHAGNTLSVVPMFAAEGSESEATQGIATHSQPEPDLGPNNDHQLKTLIGDTGAWRPGARTWKKVP